MQFKNYLIFVSLLVVLLSVTSRKAESKRSKSKSKKSLRRGNVTDSDSPTFPPVNTTAIPVKKCRRKVSVSNIYSHIILARLYAYENRLYPFMMNMDILPKSNDTNAIKNADIMKELDRAIGHEMDKTEAKALLDTFDENLKDFLNGLKSKGAFKVDGSKFIFTLNSPKKQPEPANDCRGKSQNKTVPSNNSSTVDNKTAGGNATANINNNTVSGVNPLNTQNSTADNVTAGSGNPNVNNVNNVNTPITPAIPSPNTTTQTVSATPPFNTTANANATSAPANSNANYSDGPDLLGKIKSTVPGLADVAGQLLGLNNQSQPKQA